MLDTQNCSAICVVASASKVCVTQLQASELDPVKLKVLACLEDIYLTLSCGNSDVVLHIAYMQ